MTASGHRVGIDVGGTFTDAAMLDCDQRLTVTKVPTTPPDFATGVLQALDAIAALAGVPASAIAYLSHGSTIATNAIVTDTIARTGLLTTAGFRDVLEIGTQQRAELYDLSRPRRAPIAPRELRLEVEERIDPAGMVVRPLDEADVERAAERFRELGVEAIAICFLFAFANPDHECRARELLAARLPGVAIAISSEVAPEFREYLRTSTTALNASLLPLVGGYLQQLMDGVGERGISSDVLMMRSNGGLAPVAEAARLPISLAASGPAAGVSGAVGVARHATSCDLLTFDMGGTTADVSLVLGGRAQLALRGEAGGHPINLPQMDILSVGAGGGSIAAVDRFGALSVGPESAGARPGPAGYGLGGTRPTVTDAHLILGILPSDRVLAGAIVLDQAASRAAIEEHVAGPLGCDVARAAGAILRVANAKMAAALRLMSVSRGHDPRDLTLVAYGGAGPMHAVALAEELGTGEVLIPPAPGAASALGLLLSDVRYDLSRPWVDGDRTIAASSLGGELDAIRADGTERLAGSGFVGGRAHIELAVDLRYRGQAYELMIPLGANGSAIGAEVLAGAAERFHEAHRATYGHDMRGTDVEVVTLRAQAFGLVADAIEDVDGAPAEPLEPSHAERDVLVDGAAPMPHRVLRRAMLEPGEGVEGPVVFDEGDTTILVSAGWIATRGPFETLSVRRKEALR